MRYILDFDRVLFDFYAYCDDVKAHGLEGLTFHPDVWDTLTVRDYLFGDTIPFLKTLPRGDLTIISAMTPAYGPHAREYQKRKLHDAHMEEFASEVIVMEGDKSPYVCKYSDKEGALFLDDKFVHLESVKHSCNNVQCIQMVREGDAPEGLTVSTRPDIPVIHDLEALNAIMQKI